MNRIHPYLTPRLRTACPPSPVCSFDEIKGFHSQILRVKDTESFPMILVGNKADLETDRAVTEQDRTDLGKVRPSWPTLGPGHPVARRYTTPLVTPWLARPSRRTDTMG